MRSRETLLTPMLLMEKLFSIHTIRCEVYIVIIGKAKIAFGAGPELITRNRPTDQYSVVEET